MLWALPHFVFLHTWLPCILCPSWRATHVASCIHVAQTPRSSGHNQKYLGLAIKPSFTVKYSLIIWNIITLNFSQLIKWTLSMCWRVIFLCKLGWIWMVVEVITIWQGDFTFMAQANRAPSVGWPCKLPSMIWALLQITPVWNQNDTNWMKSFTILKGKKQTASNNCATFTTKFGERSCVCKFNISLIQF